MSGFFNGRNDHYGRSFLCLFFTIILLVCTAYERPEIDRVPYDGFDSSSTISSPEKALFDIFTNDFTGYSVVKNISFRNSATGRYAGSKVITLYAVINNLYVLIGAIVLYHIYFYRPILTSHRSVIAYIHDLDGMKP